MENSIVLIAPVLPFLAENIFQNLVRNSKKKSKESVHLCDFPKENQDWIDEHIIKNVDAIRKVVELGRSARSKSNQKIRQPLSKVSYAIENDDISKFIEDNKDIILDELNVKSIERISDSDDLIKYKIKPNLRTLGQKYGSGLKNIIKELEANNSKELIKELNNCGKINLRGEKYNLSRDDIFINTEPRKGFSAVSEGEITVGLSLELDDDLILEGKIRDLVRLIQNLRKEAGFAVEDRIDLNIKLDDDYKKSLVKFEKYFKTETLVLNLNQTISNPDYSGLVKIDDGSFQVLMKKSEDKDG